MGFHDTHLAVGRFVWRVGNVQVRAPREYGKNNPHISGKPAGERVRDMPLGS